MMAAKTGRHSSCTKYVTDHQAPTGNFWLRRFERHPRWDLIGAGSCFNIFHRVVASGPVLWQLVALEHTCNGHIWFGQFLYILWCIGSIKYYCMGPQSQRHIGLLIEVSSFWLFIPHGISKTGTWTHWCAKCKASWNPKKQSVGSRCGLSLLHTSTLVASVQLTLQVPFAANPSFLQVHLTPDTLPEGDHTFDVSCNKQETVWQSFLKTPFKHAQSQCGNSQTWSEC